MDTSNLAKRMKEYECSNRHFLVRRMPVIIRCDMRAGHTYTRGFVKPFDELFIETMQRTTKYMCENIQNAVMGYVESDEITIVLVDYKNIESSAWFDNRVDKLCSISASMATMAFNKYFYEGIYNRLGTVGKEQLDIYRKSANNGALFDSRCFNIPIDDVTNNIYWRQLDAARNSVQMLGQANFSHKELQNKSCNQIQDMLMTEKNINWNDLPTYKKRGSAIVRNKYGEVFNDNGTVSVTLRDASRSENEWIIDLDMPQLKGEGRDYVESLIRFE